MKPVWIITGATSIIAERFAHLVAAEGHPLRLVGRSLELLELIAADLRCRFGVDCTCMAVDFSQNDLDLTAIFSGIDTESRLFIAHSDFTDNKHLTPQTINHAIQTNIGSTVKLINHYFNKDQSEHELLYLSSAAACRGRAKNSFYGAGKAAIEVYLEGLQQSASKHQRITIARLGFIDTRQTYGLPGIFYAAPPDACAKACYKGLKKRKRLIYIPGFWRFIMGVIKQLPHPLYRLMKHS